MSSVDSLFTGLRGTIGILPAPAAIKQEVDFSRVGNSIFPAEVFEQAHNMLSFKYLFAVALLAVAVQATPTPAAPRKKILPELPRKDKGKSSRLSY